MRQTLSLVIALASTLMGVVSAEAQITWTRQTSGYPTLSHTNGRLGLGAFSNSLSGEFYQTAAIVHAPSGAGDWTLKELAGVGSSLQTGFASGGTWIVDVYSSTAAMQTSTIGDLGSGSVSLVGTPESFGTQNRAGNTWEAFYVKFDVSGLGLTFSSNTPLFVSLRDHDSGGAWGWNETDIPSGFGPDPFSSSVFPGEVHYWTEFGRPLGVAAVDAGFVQAVPEPSSLVGLSLAGLAYLRRIAKRRPSRTT